MAYSYERTHIENLTPEIVREIIQHPYATYQDLDSLWFAVSNKFGMASPLLDEISEAIYELQHRKESVVIDLGFEEEFIQPTYVYTV